MGLSRRDKNILIYAIAFLLVSFAIFGASLMVFRLTFALPSNPNGLPLESTVFIVGGLGLLSIFLPLTCFIYYMTLRLSSRYSQSKITGEADTERVDSEGIYSGFSPDNKISRSFRFSPPAPPDSEPIFSKIDLPLLDPVHNKQFETQIITEREKVFYYKDQEPVPVDVEEEPVIIDDPKSANRLKGNISYEFVLDPMEDPPYLEKKIEAN